jgi:hypothetical protein
MASTTGRKFKFERLAGRRVLNPLVAPAGFDRFTLAAGTSVDPTSTAPIGELPHDAHIKLRPTSQQGRNQ